jgi:hypothetical protein
MSSDGSYAEFNEFIDLTAFSEHDESDDNDLNEINDPNEFAESNEFNDQLDFIEQDNFHDIIDEFDPLGDPFDANNDNFLPIEQQTVELAPVDDVGEELENILNYAGPLLGVDLHALAPQLSIPEVAAPDIQPSDESSSGSEASSEAANPASPNDLFPAQTSENGSEQSSSSSSESSSSSGSDDTPPGRYPAYKARFSSSEAARKHRRKTKRKANQDPELHIVKQNRDAWVRKLYEAMIDTSEMIDGPKSTHRKRFLACEFDQQDLEATAWHVFGKVIAVHEKGWTRPLIYLKEAKRGNNVDEKPNSAASRLVNLCVVLKKSKACCNDAIEGGLTLSRLVYNPIQAYNQKVGNNGANQVRAVRLKAGTEALGHNIGKKSKKAEKEPEDVPEDDEEDDEQEA